MGSFVSSSQLLNLSGSHTQRMAMLLASPPVDLVTKDNNPWPGVLMAGRHRCPGGFHVSAFSPLSQILLNAWPLSIGQGAASVFLHPPIPPFPRLVSPQLLSRCHQGLSQEILSPMLSKVHGSVFVVTDTPDSVL